jgi:hypothetical protein
LNHEVSFNAVLEIPRGSLSRFKELNLILPKGSLPYALRLLLIRGHPTMMSISPAGRLCVSIPADRWLTFHGHGSAAGSSPVVPAFFSVRPSAQASPKHVQCKLKARLYLGFYEDRSDPYLIYRLIYRQRITGSIPIILGI